MAATAAPVAPPPVTLVTRSGSQDLRPRARNLRPLVVGFLIFLLAFAVRALWIRGLGHDLVWIDEQEFATIGAGLARGDGYTGDSFRANPTLPAYLAAVFRLFGERYDVARLGLALLGAGTCVLLFRIGSLLSPAVGVVSGVLLALYPPHVYLAGVLYVDGLQTFLCTWLLDVLVHAHARRRPLARALAAGLLLGLALLTRPLVLVALPALCVAWLLADRRPWRTRVAFCAVLTLASMLTVLPWTIRNERVYGRFVLVSSGFWTKLFEGNSELANGGPDDRDLMIDSEEWRARLERLPATEREAIEAKYAPVRPAIGRLVDEIGDLGIARDEVLRPYARAFFTENPIRTAGLAARKLVTLFSPFSKTETTNDHTGELFRFAAAVSFYPVLVLAIAGAWLARDRLRDLLPVWALAGSIIAAYTLLTACTRFRLPVDPYLILLAAVALVAARDRWSARWT